MFRCEGVTKGPRPGWSGDDVMRRVRFNQSLGEELTTKHIDVIADRHYFRLMMKMFEGGSRMGPGDRTKALVLRGLNFLHMSRLQVRRVKRNAVIDDTGAESFVRQQHVLRRMTPVGPGQGLKNFQTRSQLADDRLSMRTEGKLRIQGQTQDRRRLIELEEFPVEEDLGVMRILVRVSREEGYCRFFRREGEVLPLCPLGNLRQIAIETGVDLRKIGSIACFDDGEIVSVTDGQFCACGKIPNKVVEKNRR